MMNENSKQSLNSGKAVAEFYQKKADEAKEKEEARQLEVEKVALLKESNELKKREIKENNRSAEKERFIHESNRDDLIDMKPNVFGLGVNLNEIWRRFKKWISK